MGGVPPAEDHSELCSLNLPESPKAAAAAAAGLESAPFRDLFFFPFFLAVAIINPYLKAGVGGVF